jgi:hypothetical protein
MRAMGAGPVLAFAGMMGGVVALVAATVRPAMAEWRALGDIGVGTLAVAALLLYLYSILLLRLFLLVLPLRAGEIAAGSGQEFVYQVYILFYLLLFNALMRSAMLPLPLVRLLYLALGARLGANTYTSGVICDPMFVRIGANSIVGEGALLVPHVIEGDRLGHYPIAIGSHVTIGAHAVLLSGVVVGDHAMIGANSVLAKGARVGAGEVWGGNPARRLR